MKSRAAEREVEPARSESQREISEKPREKRTGEVGEKSERSQGEVGEKRTGEVGEQSERSQGEVGEKPREKWARSQREVGEKSAGRRRFELVMLRLSECDSITSATPGVR